MKAVLLAAGLGTRLRPLTDAVPKCLVPIHGRPLLAIWLESLDAAGIGPFLVNTHHLAADVQRFVELSPYHSDVTLVHEPSLLGTGGTLLANRSFFGRGPVLVAHADNICLCDWRAFVRAHENRTPGTVLTMMTYVTDTPESCGIVQLNDRGVVIGFHEKVANPPGNLANGAVYIVEQEVVEFMAALPTSTVDFSTEVLPHFVGRMQTWQNVGPHRDIGTISSWQAAQADVDVKISVGKLEAHDGKH